MRYLWFAFSGLLSLLVIVLLALALAILYLGDSVPDHSTLAQKELPQITRLYANGGELVGEIAKEHRIYVSIRDIPPFVAQAVITAEDRRFYEHHGVDPVRLFGAILTNISLVAEGKQMQGASTITQQMAKNVLLTHERTLTRKLKEMIIAHRVERDYTKEEILELYLNAIYFGSKAYGIGYAALQYFDKSIKQLTLDEAATLAAMIKAPNNYSPVKHTEKLRERRNWILKEMVKLGYVDANRANEAIAKPIVKPNLAKKKNKLNQYVENEVLQQLDYLQVAYNLPKDGMKVNSTIDLKMQKVATAALRRGLSRYEERHGYQGPFARIVDVEEWQAGLMVLGKPAALGDWSLAAVLKVDTAMQMVQMGLKDGTIFSIPFSRLTWMHSLANQESGNLKLYDVLTIGDVLIVEALQHKEDPNVTYYEVRQLPEVNGAVVVMDPKDGAIYAMAGGFDYNKSQFNRATQAFRQPGSAIKPFIALTAFEKGYNPSTLIADEEIAFTVEEKAEGGDEEEKTWTPKNYTGEYHGPTTIRKGIENSYNAMTVHLGVAVGIDAVADTLQRFHIVDAPVRNLSVVLGSQETNLVRLAKAYAMIANGGRVITPSFIDEVRRMDNKLLYRRSNHPCKANCQITDPESAYQTLSILRGVVERGTASKVNHLGIHLAGKTGTTNDSKDAWFVGMTNDYVVGVYVGYDQPRSLGTKEAGGSVALPIAEDVFAELYKNRSSRPFPMPSGIKIFKVDYDTGKLFSKTDGTGTEVHEAFKISGKALATMLEDTALTVLRANAETLEVEEVVLEPAKEKKKIPTLEKPALMLYNVEENHPAGTDGLY